MEPAEYGRMYHAEDQLWWYRGLRLNLHAAFQRAGVPQAGRVLDAGCGTGANLASLTRLFDRLTGVDLSTQAVAYCRARGLRRTVAADVNGLPFRSATFDGVLCSDVFECAEVDERRGLRELARVTRPGGRIIVTVAAYQFLLGEHDRAVHCVRRYTKRRARRVFGSDDVKVARMRYLFGSLAVPIIAYRLTSRRRCAAMPTSDVFPFPRWVDGLLYTIVRLEAFVARFAPLPFGTTLLIELERR
jgi:SAM-dependent methyltransferase